MRNEPTLLGLLLVAGCAAQDPSPLDETRFAGLPDFDARWNYADPESSERTFRELLAEHPGADPRWILELRTQVARALGLQRKFDEALAELAAVEENEASHRGRVRVRVLLETGRVHRSRGAGGSNPTPFFLEAWERARPLDEDGLAVDAAHMVALAPPSGETALEWNHRALDLAESSSDPDARRWRGSLWNNVGWTHHEAGRFEQALEAFGRSRTAFSDEGHEARARIARWSEARALRSLERWSEALELQRALERELSALGEEDGYVFEELAENLLALGLTEQAAPWFRRAFEALREDAYLQRDEPQRLERLERLSN